MTTDLHVHRLSTNPRQTICGKSVSDVLAADVQHPDDVTCEPCARNATTSDDPASFLLRDGVTSSTTVYNARCYICRDPEFAAMGLPLCYPCPTCGAHVPADDITCDNGHDTYPEHYGPAPDGAPQVTSLPDIETYTPTDPPEPDTVAAITGRIKERIQAERKAHRK